MGLTRVNMRWPGDFRMSTHYYLLPLLTATHYYFSKGMSHFYPYLVEYASSFVKSEFLFGEIKRLSEKFVYHFLNMFENLSAKIR